MRKGLLSILVLLVYALLHGQTNIFTENWESGPGVWTVANENATNGWYLGEATSAPGGGSHSMYISSDGGDTNTYSTSATSTAYVYRDVTFSNLADLSYISLRFDIVSRGQSNNDYVRVYLLPDSITPSGSNTSISTTDTDAYSEYRLGLDRYNVNTLISPVGGWQNVEIVLPNTMNGQTGRLAFKWCNDNTAGEQPPASIDNITLAMFQTTDPAPPARAVAPINGNSFIPVTPTLSWTANTNGPQPSGYSLYIGTTNPPQGNAVYTGNLTTYTPASPLQNNTSYYWKVVPTNNAGDTQNCPVWSFTTISDNLAAVGTGGITGREVPFNMAYYTSLSQVIYLAEDLTAIEHGSRISQIAYSYVSTNNTNLSESIAVYIAHTGLNSFASTTSWVPVNDFTHVYSGPITAQSPSSYAPIVFNQDPFIYNGGNIVVMVAELDPEFKTIYNSSNWYMSNTPNQNRALYQRTNGTPIDITSPPAGNAPMAYIPNTTFAFVLPAGRNLFLQPTTINLVSLNQNTPITRSISFRSEAEQPITVTAITATAGISTTQTLPFTVPAGGTVAVDFTIVSTSLNSPFTGTITATSDAQNGPTHTVNVTATTVYPERMVVIGGATTTPENSVPMHVFWTYNVSESIYLPSDINRPSGEILTQIQYHYNAVQNYTQEVSVFMGYTALDQFAGSGVENFVPINTLTEVFSGTFNLTNQLDPVTGGSWATIVLDIPFVYDDTQNLVIAFLDNTAGNVGNSSCAFYHYPTPGAYRSIRNFGSNTPYDPDDLHNSNAGYYQSVPNMRMLFAPAISGPYISVPQRNINFGYIPLNATQTRSISIENLGTDDLVISSITLPQYMHSTTTPLTIAPSGSQEITFTLTPLASGLYNRNITINSNDTGNPALSIVASAFGVPTSMVLVSGGTTTPIQTVPLNCNNTYSYSQSIYLANELNRAAGEIISRLQYHFNAYEIINQEVTIYMGNTTLEALTGFVPITTLTQVYQGAFTASNDIDPVSGGVWIDILLNEPFFYNASQNLIIAVVENQSGRYYSTNNSFYHIPTETNRSVYHHNADTPYDPSTHTAFNLLQSVPNIRLFFDPPIQGPYIYIPTRRLSFGEISLYHPTTQSLTIANLGTETLTVGSISLPMNMQYAPMGLINIPPDGSTTIDFILTPIYQGPYSADIVVYSNSTSNPAIPISVTASVLPEHLALVGEGVLDNQSLPFEPFYRYSYSQSLYLPADLPQELSDGAEITHIGYQYNGQETLSQTVQIYMGYTTQSAFVDNVSSYIPASELTLVYNGTLSLQASEGWTALLTLSTPFVYDASRNLVIALNEVQGGASNGSIVEFYCTSKTTNQSIVMHHDTPNTPYDVENPTFYTARFVRQAVPNIRLGYEPAGLPRPRALTSEIGYGRISLSWMSPIESVDGDFMGYNVYRDNVDIVGALNELEYVDTDIVGSETYVYKVTAVYEVNNAMIESSPSNAITVTALASQVTAHPPVNLVATGTTGQIPLSWQPGIVILDESFEYSIPQLWLQDEGDNDWIGWEHSLSGGIAGSGYVYSSSLDFAGNVIATQNFLLSPIISVPLAGAWLNYWVGGFDADTANESYHISIASPPSSSIHDGGFTLVYSGALTTHNWQRQTLDLINFAGDEIRIAFWHTTNPSQSRNRLKLDGVEIVKVNETAENLPLFYRVYSDNGDTPIVDNVMQTNTTLPAFTASGVYEVYVTAVYDESGVVESTPSNVEMISYTHSDTDDVVASPSTKLVGNYPNPFNPTTNISFDLAHPAHVCIEIYNIKGQRVKTLTSDIFETGRHNVVWNGADELGRSVGSGVYFYRMNTAGYNSVRKMLLLK